MSNFMQVVVHALKGIEIFKSIALLKYKYIKLIDDNGVQYIGI